MQLSVDNAAGVSVQTGNITHRNINLRQYEL